MTNAEIAKTISGRCDHLPAFDDWELQQHIEEGNDSPQPICAMCVTGALDQKDEEVWRLKAMMTEQDRELANLKLELEVERREHLKLSARMLGIIAQQERTRHERSEDR